MEGTKRRYLEAALFLSVLVLAVYFNILDNEATNWDDPALFARPEIQQMTAGNIGQVLSMNSLATYQPVRDLTYMLDYRLWGPGPKAVIFGMHLQSMVLYLLMILACWLFLLELFRIFVDDDSLAFLWATLTSILFAVHPVHVESVAWLYARKEPLLGLFTFLSLWAFIRARLSSWLYYPACVLFLVLAILSKPTAVMIPGAVMVLDLAIQKRRPTASFWKTRLFVYLPMLIVAVPMGLHLVTMMETAGGVKGYHGGSFWNNLLAVAQIFMSYVSLIGFTLNYSADYPIKLYASPHAWQAWLYVALNLIVIAGAVAAFVKRRYLVAFFAAWFYLFLLPVSHVFPISQIMADRYALLPSLSWCVLLGYGFSRLWLLRLEPGRFSPEFPKLISVAVFSMVTIFYSFMTFAQNDVWKDSQTLWETTLARYPNSSPGNVNLAAIYLSQLRFREVQELCIRAIKEKPYDYLAISNLALAQMMMGQHDHAINNYRQALKLRPDLVKARMGLAYAYWLSKDYEPAYLLYDRLMKEGLIGDRADMTMYYYRVGYAAFKTGKKAEAGMYLERAMATAFRSPQYLDHIGAVYTSMGEFTKARAAFAAFYPYVRDDRTRMQVARVVELLDRRINGPSTAGEPPEKP